MYGRPGEYAKGHGEPPRKSNARVTLIVVGIVLSIMVAIIAFVFIQIRSNVRAREARQRERQCAAARANFGRTSAAENFPDARGALADVENSCTDASDVPKLRADLEARAAVAAKRNLEEAKAHPIDMEKQARGLPTGTKRTLEEAANDTTYAGKDKSYAGSANGSCSDAPKDDGYFKLACRHIIEARASGADCPMVTANAIIHFDACSMKWADECEVNGAKQSFECFYRPGAGVRVTFISAW